MNAAKFLRKAFLRTPSVVTSENVFHHIRVSRKLVKRMHNNKKFVAETLLME